MRYREPIRSDFETEEDYEDAMDLDADICQYMSDAYLGGYSHCQVFNFYGLYCK